MWQKSQCKVPGWLHDYRIVQSVVDGVIERCRRCQTEQFFSFKLPSIEYIKYHLRQTLQPSNKRFKTEYGKR